MSTPSSSHRVSLAAVITAARAGSLRHAQAMFHAGGFAHQTDNPAALAVKARLLKDEALRAPKALQPALFCEAADHYAAADALLSQPYTQINEASLRLLAGDSVRAVARASALRNAVSDGAGFAETPYYLAATRAEAHLICGEFALAEHALAEAMAHNPQGWSDHASTLRQFELLSTALNADAKWLDAYRPPASLNFAGHMGIAAALSGYLRREVDDFLDQTCIGFGYGALAVGSDIVIAEALLARGAELNVVLPTQIDVFIAQSVTPYEPSWRPRFDACLAAAASVQCVTSVSGAYEPLATKLAADVAMGASVLNARRLESEAVQLLVIDEGEGRFGTGLGTSYLGDRWNNGGAQKIIVLPRNAPLTKPAPNATGREGRSDRQLAALLWIGFDGVDALDDATFARMLDAEIRPLVTAARALPTQPRWRFPCGNARVAAFDDPDCAWHYAQALLNMPTSRLPLIIAGHFALAHSVVEPPALIGPALADLATVAASALPGVLTATETLTAALFVNHADDLFAEEIGEAGPYHLFALSPR